MGADAPLEAVRAAAYRIPTEGPEADGTAQWAATTLVTVHATAGGQQGFGYSYGSDGMVPVVERVLGPRLIGREALDIDAAHQMMQQAVRNDGREGIASTAMSAVDVALWDLKARLLGLPLLKLLGRVRAAALLYGSGGFTNESPDALRRQLGSWAERGLRAVKMKVGAQPARDLERVRLARAAVGPDVALMVDANGAYTPPQALELASGFRALDVRWLEEPVSSDDLDGLRFVRERAPAGLQIAAGEYGFDVWAFRRMLEAQAVDVLQADATRCGGVTGFLKAAVLCETFFRPLSAHTAPSLHAQLGCAVRPLVHVEYFFDHARIEQRYFDGFIEPRLGAIAPDLTRPGLGFVFKEGDAACHRVR